MITIFEDIFDKQENKEIEVLELIDDEWDTELDMPDKPDTWSTGQVKDVWSVG